LDLLFDEICTSPFGDNPGYDGVRLYPTFTRLAPTIQTLLETPGDFCTTCNWCICPGLDLPPLPFGETEAYTALQATWAGCSSVDPCEACPDYPSEQFTACESNGTHRVITQLVLRGLGMDGVFPQEVLNAFRYFTVLDLRNGSSDTPNVFTPQSCVNVTRCELPGVTCDLPFPLCSEEALPSLTQGEVDMVRTAMIAIGVILGVVLITWVVVYVIPRRKEKQKRLSQYYPPKELGVVYEPAGNERFITMTTGKGFTVQKVPVEHVELTIVADPDGSPMIKDV
jgi:hypothetical protein